MSQNERTGIRSLTYSAWHRSKSIKRFLNGNEVVASRLTMIDIDGAFVEAKHPYDRPPVALIETAEVSRRLTPNDRYRKNAEVLYQVGKAANIPVFVVLYLPSSTPNPVDDRWPDIEEFYIQEWYPIRDNKWSVCSPEKYARFLVGLRQGHLRIKNGYQFIFQFDPTIEQLSDADLDRRWYIDHYSKRDFKP